MMKNTKEDMGLAPYITKAASSQTFHTIRYLVDKDRIADAYRAYAYFRWVDDSLDADSVSSVERSAFVERQKSLLEKCYRGETPRDADIHEQMLVDLVRRDLEKNSGLQIYLRNMMGVMSFDTARRGRLISQVELNEYTHLLASAVTESMHYFIGHCCASPHDDTRYLAVTAAHITHMLRDTFDDVQAGYFNIPREVLDANHISPFDVQSDAYRLWVKSRVQLAKKYFATGRDYLSRVQNPRCRLAGFAYTARFEWLLDTFEREGYLLRPQYEERKSFGRCVSMMASAFSSMLPWRSVKLGENIHVVARGDSPEAISR
ncbi:MAG: squalene/phytoene synthase family protein [Anaerolineales bacterium]